MRSKMCLSPFRKRYGDRLEDAFKEGTAQRKAGAAQRKEGTAEDAKDAEVKER